MDYLDLINKKDWDKIIKNIKDINQNIWNNNNLLHYSAIQNDIDLLNKLIKLDVNLKQTNNNSQNILHIASENGYNNYIKKILEFDFKLVYNKDFKGNNLFHNLFNNKEILESIFKTYPKLDYKTLLNQINNNKQTILSLAIESGNFDVTKILLENKHINLTGSLFNRPLIIIVQSQYFTTDQKEELIKIYLKNSGDINILDEQGINSLFYAIMNNDYDLVKFLIEKGIEYNYLSPVSTLHSIREAYSFSILNKDDRIIKLLLSKIDSDDKVDKYNDSLAHYVLLFRLNKKDGNKELEKKILELNTNFNLQNIEGDNIMHLISQNDWKAFKSQIVNHPKTLNILDTNNKGKTALDYISRKDKKEFLEIIAKNYKKNNNDSRSISLISKLIKNKKIKLDKEEEIKEINLVNNYQYVQHSKFRATMIEVIIYSIYLLKKYPEILIAPIHLGKFDDLIDLQLSSSITLMANPFYSSSIFTFIILWEDNNNYFTSPKLISSLKEIIKAKKYKFIFLYLSLGNKNNLHANIILIDIKNKSIERFDPYGNVENEVDIFLHKFFKPIKKFKYLAPSQFMNQSSFQTLSNESDIRNKKIGDLGGFCLAWCIWYIELRINNDLPPAKVVEKSIKKLIKENVIFIDFIRNYAEHLYKFANKFYNQSNLDKKNINKKIQSNEDIEILKQHIINELASLKKL